MLSEEEEVVEEEEEEEEEEEDMGMADAMLLRGVHLRKLRELAEADERERNETSDCNNNNNNNNSSDNPLSYQKDEQQQQQQQQDEFITLSNGARVLRYDSYLSHQRYYDDLKHIDYRYIDYGAGCVIQQDKTLGKGGLCWDAAFILAEHLLNNRIAAAVGGCAPNNNNYNNNEEEEEKNTILELGAGTGVCGIWLAKKTSCHIQITDLPALMNLMQRNISLNFESLQPDDYMTEEDIVAMYGSDDAMHHHSTHGKNKGTCDAQVLEWGPQPQNHKTFSVIVGADVVASLYDPIALADTIHQLCHKNTKVYISYKGRLDGPHLRFEQRMRELFTTVDPRVTPQSRNKNPGVFILQASGPR